MSVYAEVLYQSCEHPDCPPEPGYVRANMTSEWPPVHSFAACQIRAVRSEAPRSLCFHVVKYLTKRSCRTLYLQPVNSGKGTLKFVVATWFEDRGCRLLIALYFRLTVQLTPVQDGADLSEVSPSDLPITILCGGKLEPAGPSIPQDCQTFSFEAANTSSFYPPAHRTPLPSTQLCGHNKILRPSLLQAVATSSPP